MVAHGGKPVPADDLVQYLRTVMNCVFREAPRQGGKADEISGKQYEVRRKRVDVSDNPAKEPRLRVLVEVDVADLNNPKTLESRRQIANAEGSRYNTELVT